MINYGLLQEASDYYESIGYPRVESPWLVTEAISNITKPMSATNYYVTKEYRGDYKKVFVASGEQSFLYLINKGFLPKSGKYHTITPCMRNDSFDDKHSKYFMKLELIEINHLSNKNWNPVMSSGKVIRDARMVLSQFTKKVIEDVDTDLGADLS